MKAVFKFNLVPDLRSNWNQQIATELPKGAKILHVNAQRDKIFIWAIIDDQEEETETRHFLIRGTGVEIPEEAVDKIQYLGTVIMFEGDAILHIFEVEE